MARSISFSINASISGSILITDTPSLTEIFSYDFGSTAAVSMALTGTDIGPTWTWSGGASQTDNEFDAEVTNGDSITLAVQNPDAITQISLAGDSIAGPIFDLSLVPNATSISVANNQLTGSIPASLSSLASLTTFGCGENVGIDGNIPSLPPALQLFDVNGCSLTGVVPGFTVPASLAVFYAPGNALSGAAVNAILAACVAAGVTNAAIDLSGGSNSAPSGQGNTDVATLQGAGCTVVVNE